jgi:hypothetical protein
MTPKSYLPRTRTGALRSSTSSDRDALYWPPILGDGANVRLMVIIVLEVPLDELREVQRTKQEKLCTLEGRGNLRMDL